MVALVSTACGTIDESLTLPVVSSPESDGGPSGQSPVNPRDGAVTDGGPNRADGGMADAATDGAIDPPPSGMRATDPVVLYRFDEGAGSTVEDRSSVTPALDLSIDDTSRVTWMDDGLRIDSPTVLRTSAAAGKINQACQSTGAITLEAWVTPQAPSASGPARIVTLSTSITERNATLGQGGPLVLASVWAARLRTTSTLENGLPEFATAEGTATASLHHVVFVHQSNGNERLYVDDTPLREGSRAGDFSTWGNYVLHVGNEATMDRPWLGTLHLIAVFCRALSAQEVADHFTAGP